ncbi:MAG: hypothetical protein GY751_14425 [Bacteroidetes bacterium]|nr:hypothetical protein [Bacteroidota bacterium]
MKSAYFSKRALKALNRFGDILIPANGEFPSFSQYGGLEHIDQMVYYAPMDDIGDLNMALGIFNFLPTFILRFLIHLMATSQNMGGPVAPLLRQLNLAIRGLIFACYYSERPGSSYNGKDPVEVINFEINRVTD